MKYGWRPGAFNKARWEYANSVKNKWAKPSSYDEINCKRMWCGLEGPYLPDKVWQILHQCQRVLLPSKVTPKNSKAWIALKISFAFELMKLQKWERGDRSAFRLHKRKLLHHNQNKIIWKMLQNKKLKGINGISFMKFVACNTKEKSRSLVQLRLDNWGCTQMN